MESITLIAKESYPRADKLIVQETEYTRSFIKQLCDKGMIFLNGIPLKKCGEGLKAGDSLFITVPDPVEISARPQDIPLDIIYEDDDLFVINKPQGMVTHPAVGSPDGTLVNALMFYSNRLSSINGEIRPGIVHRLDKNTSGLLVVAKNDKAHLSLSQQIAEKSAVRKYVALVDGNIKESEGVIEQPIGRNPKDRKLMAVVNNGRYAKTKYRVIERFYIYTLVEFTLLTGRTHQIRVHSKFIQHSVVGDDAYGGSKLKGIEGQLLHAYELSFDHPSGLGRMRFQCDLPEYFKDVLRQLKSANSERLTLLD